MTTADTTDTATKDISLDIKAKTVEFTDGRGNTWLWGEGESHDPADRVGGPFTIHDIDDEDTTWDKWFIFSPADSFFPAYWAICGSSWEDAYERLCEWKEEYFRIPDEDLKDYNEDSLSYSPNGIPVDMESVQGFEVTLSTVRSE